MKDFKKEFMKKSIRSLFNDACNNNPTMLLMYYLAYPLVIVFEKIKFTPNMVTLLSSLFLLISIFFLIEKNSLIYFMFYYFISQLLDYADGTLARKIRLIRKKGELDLDHLSDIVKICITQISLGVYFQLFIIWFFVVLSIILFLFFVFNEEKNKNKNSKDYKKKLIRKRYEVINFLYKIPVIGHILKFLYRFCTSLQGHSVLTFIIAPINIFFCIAVLIYFLIVVSVSIIKFKKKFI